MVKRFCLICVLAFVPLILAACTAKTDTSSSHQDFAAPSNLYFDFETNMFRWDPVEGATGYIISYGHHDTTVTTNCAPIPQYANAGKADFSVSASAPNRWGNKSTTELEIKLEIDDINANVRVDDDGLFTWDDFDDDAFSFAIYLTGEDIVYPEIGFSKGIPFSYFANYSYGKTSVRVGAYILPTYKRTENIANTPTFFYRQGYRSEPFHYNVDKAPTPQNINLNRESGILTCDAVLDATKYFVDIHKNGTSLGHYWEMYTKNDTPSFDAVFTVWTNTRSTDPVKYGAGDYNFQVIARIGNVLNIDGLPTVFRDSDNAVLQDDLTIEFQNLPEIVVSAESGGYTWGKSADANYGYWLQRGGKKTYFGLSDNSLPFEKIDADLEFATAHNYIDGEGDIFITINASSMVFYYDTNTGIVTCYSDVFATPFIYIPE